MKRRNFQHYTYHTYFDTKTNSHVTVAVSTYGGKIVKGYAKCSAADAYDPEIGEKLAASRCNAKIAKRRTARAMSQYKECLYIRDVIDEQIKKVQDYVADAIDAEQEANYELNALLNKLL